MCMKCPLLWLLIFLIHEEFLHHLQIPNGSCLRFVLPQSNSLIGELHRSYDHLHNGWYTLKSVYQACWNIWRRLKNKAFYMYYLIKIYRHHRGIPLVSTPILQMRKPKFTEMYNFSQINHLAVGLAGISGRLDSRISALIWLVNLFVFLTSL